MEKQLKAKEESYDDLERKMITMEKQFKAKVCNDLLLKGVE
jgi:hypothetical protein